jgi:hypothetical protein
MELDGFVKQFPILAGAVPNPSAYKLDKKAIPKNEKGAKVNRLETVPEATENSTPPQPETLGKSVDAKLAKILRFKFQFDMQTHTHI